jgi:hypothetical protein
MRNPPNVPARTSGTKTIANTFQRTGQFVSAHRDGRLGGGAALRSKSTSVPSACFSCENAVIAACPRYRALVRISVMERLS